MSGIDIGLRLVQTKIQMVLINTNEKKVLYVLVMSRTCFRVNPHSIVA